MKVKFYPERKTSKDGKSALWCYVREFKETIYLNTGQRIDPTLWDNDSQRANLRLTRNNIIKGELKSLNLFLDKYESKIYDIERVVRSQKPNASFSVVADEIKKQFEKKKEGFFDIYDDFLKIKRQEVSKQSLFKFNRLRSLLEDYQKLNRERLDFDKITPLFFSKFYSFLIEDKNMLNNTANKNIQFLKTFLIWANNNGYTENSSYRIFRTKTEESEIIYLTESELERLYNLDIDDERLKRVRDIFVFQCYTGVRYSDIQNISKEDIQNSTWYLRTQKTHQIIEIPLNSYALSILARYSEFPKPLPVISNQKMNKYLKELCEIAGIDDTVKVVKYKGSKRIETTYKKYEVIGTHTARRTFVSLSLQKGMKPESIMAITGHKTYRMMQRYLKIGQEHIRSEMEKAWGRNLRLV
uniref:Site-specific integrase n=1 Tax=Ignavibacterium album TaxID=591197 RepID=A0A7V2ZL52_9BACT